MVLKSYRSPKTEIRESSINEKGLFAKAFIAKDEIVVVRSGHIINDEELRRKRDVVGDADLQISDVFYLAPLSREEFKNIMTFVNHSCEPNLGIMGNCIFVAMRDINIGEELYLDYAMFDNNDTSFVCNCANPTCRKTITGRDWKRKELQKKYGFYFSSYLLRKINKNK